MQTDTAEVQLCSGAITASKVRAGAAPWEWCGFSSFLAWASAGVAAATATIAARVSKLLRNRVRRCMSVQRQVERPHILADRGARR